MARLTALQSESSNRQAVYKCLTKKLLDYCYAPLSPSSEPMVDYALFLSPSPVGDHVNILPTMPFPQGHVFSQFLVSLYIQV